jgi:hypothetical protein
VSPRSFCVSAKPESTISWWAITSPTAQIATGAQRSMSFSFKRGGV